jgi:hypothetical protein
MLGSGKAIAGRGAVDEIDDLPRLLDTYGGAPQDWMKMTSGSYRGADGFRFETHWYENAQTRIRVEQKTKIYR